MNEQRSNSDPIYPVGAFTDRAIPLSGVARKAVSLPPFAPTTPADELRTTIWQQLRAISASNLSPTDAVLIRSLLDGRAEQEVAEYGKVYSLDEMSRYLKAKVAGASSKPPRTHKAR